MAKGDVVTDPAGRDAVLGDVGAEIIFENDCVRVWEVLLEPGQTQHWHQHHHPYLVIAIEEAHNVMAFLDGSSPRTMHETVGRVVYREAGEPHNLTNVGQTRYRSRLVELKSSGGAAASFGAPSVTSSVEPRRYSGVAAERARVQAGSHVEPDAAEGLARFREIMLEPDHLDWVDKSLDGLAQKMLWRDDDSGASIALVRFRQGSGVPVPHVHASNQFMYCISGRYSYTATDITLTAGSFYWNPKGSVHGPTLAESDAVLLEFYDGPHYSSQPGWYANREDAR